MPRLFRGWWVVIGGIGIQATLAGVLYQAYTAYVVPMMAEFGWSRTVFAGVASLQQVELGITGPLQGWLLDRFGARAVIRVGIVIAALGLVLVSLTQSIPWLYGSFFIASVGATLAGYLSISTAVVHWFERKRARALGLVSTGISLAGILVVVVAWSLSTFGWRATALASSMLLLALGLPLAQLIADPPERYGLRPDGGPPSAPAGQAHLPAAEPVFTLGQVLRTPAFWLIAFGQAAALLVVASVSVHLVPAVSQALELPLQLAATAVTLMTSVSLVGQLIGGVLGDRFDKRAICALAMVGHAAGLLVLAFAVEFWMVALFALLHGGAWGVRGPLMPAIRADYFGRAVFGKVIGVSNLVVMLGSVAGPLIVASFADQTGSYRLGFSVLAVLSLVGCLFFALASPPRPPSSPARHPSAQPALAPLGYHSTPPPSG
ncbi:MAG: MFS transporter [Chloroflexi bacterium]|nr:MFS transporter [Chloroflexota bacterium]